MHCTEKNTKNCCIRISSLHIHICVDLVKHKTFISRIEISQSKSSEQLILKFHFIKFGFCNVQSLMAFLYSSILMIHNLAAYMLVTVKQRKRTRVIKRTPIFADLVQEGSNSSITRNIVTNIKLNLPVIVKSLVKIKSMQSFKLYLPQNELLQKLN